MKILLTLLICLLIASCNTHKESEPDNFGIIFEINTYTDSVYAAQVKKQRFEDSLTCLMVLPLDVEFMTNTLKEITIKKGSNYISSKFLGLYKGEGYYYWGKESIAWFKDTCSAKKAYKILLQIQRDQAKKDSISHLRNQIKPLNK